MRNALFSKKTFFCHLVMIQLQDIRCEQNISFFIRDNSVPCFGRCPHVVVANISPHFSPSLSCYQSLQQQKFSLDVSDNTTDGKMSCNTSFSWNIKPNFLWSIQKRINPPGWTIRMMKTPRAKIEMKTNHMIYCIQIKNISVQFKFINIEWEKQGASRSFIL